ncbi:MAG: glycoside hydrolase family 9 protein [Acidobacteriota bacterium]
MKPFHPGMLFLLLLAANAAAFSRNGHPLVIGGSGYYEAPGVNVIMFDDFYPDGHQGGLTIIQCGRRIAANGDLRLEPTPGQWAPVPAMGVRRIDTAAGRISVRLWYPDSSKDRKGFNPIAYPDLRFAYTVRTEPAEEGGIRVIVDLDKELPQEWADKVGFNLELFPGEYFGEHFIMDGRTGIFPRQASDLLTKDREGHLQVAPLAEGRMLTAAPAAAAKRLSIRGVNRDLQLIDERGLHNNGWFVVRSVIPSGVTKHAVEWIITPAQDDAWSYAPVVQVSQVGYHPAQKKFAVIELDKRTTTPLSVQLVKITPDTQIVVKEESHPDVWGHFLRYAYARFDFSDVKDEGLYVIRYGNVTSNEFEIRKDIYAEHVWQPTLQYFLPIQMCHMRVADRYKVWHGLCHMDDAQMAPVNYNHFDGYYQHGSTLTAYKPGEHVPGLDIGGWHDAGDYDLRIESQAETVYKLALAEELFGSAYDNTTVDEPSRSAMLNKPDGKPDLIQQIGHGMLSIVGAYESMGRLYRGIICSQLPQYVHLGDASTITDNLVYRADAPDPVLHRPLPNDDGWVFTEESPEHELLTAQALAAASRVLKKENPALAAKCLKVAEALLQKNSGAGMKEKFNAAAELWLATSKKEYETLLRSGAPVLSSHILRYSETIGRVCAAMHDETFRASVEESVRSMFASIRKQQTENPYGVPYKPYIWGAGWGIQAFGVKQLFLHLGFPTIFSSEYAFNALNFVLGVHPGENTSSFASGIGAHSLTTAYGTNRDEWSYIPGGIGSGTALIRPDLPELKVWPYFWQQTEYVLGGGTADYLLLAMAADRLFNKK